MLSWSRMKGAAVLNPYPTARVLAATIKKSGDYDLIMCGRQAGDWDAGQVGPLLAEELNLPCITFVCKIKGDKHGLRLQRQVDGHGDPGNTTSRVDNCNQ